MNPTYAPILRVLPAEMDGLQRCDAKTRQGILPILRIVRARTDHSATHLGRAVSEICRAWPAGLPVFVEIEDVPDPNDWREPSSPFLSVHDYLRAKGRLTLPILPFHAEAWEIDDVASLCKQDTGLIGIRIYDDDLDDIDHVMSRISHIRGELSVAPTRVQLLVDLGALRPDRMMVQRERLLGFVAELERNRYAGITVAGSSVPESFDRRFPKDSLREVIKFETQLWRFVQRRTGFAVGLGDHVVVRPNYVDVKGPFANIHGKVIYAVKDAIAICRGRPRAKEKLESQHKRLATMLVDSNYFMGEGFSWGDRQLALIARGQKQIGLPGRILEISVCHHIVQMARQFAEETATI